MAQTAHEPINEADIETLRKIASYRQNCIADTEMQQLTTLRVEEKWQEALTAVGVEMDFDPAQPDQDLTATARTVLMEDIRNVRADLLLRNFPVDPDGRLTLGVTVPLTTYAPPETPRNVRQNWLAAAGPLRRRDPQVVRLTLQSLIGPNHPYRWDNARWLWDEREAGAGEERRWGVSGLDLALLGVHDRERHIELLQARCAGTPTPADRAALSILMQDMGRIDEALALFHIQLDENVQAVLLNQPLNLYYAGLAKEWCLSITSTLRSCALWRLESALREEDARLQAWIAAKPGRKRQLVRRRLHALPHQGSASKTSLFLTLRMDGQPGVRFELENTSINDRWSFALWQRPLDLELLRFGLLDLPSVS